MGHYSVTRRRSERRLSGKSIAANTSSRSTSTDAPTRFNWSSYASEHTWWTVQNIERIDGRNTCAKLALPVTRWSALIE